VKRDTQVFVEVANYGRHVNVFLYAPEAEPPAEPQLHMQPETAQRLMDALWACGFRATQGKQSEGQFAAQGRHLEDMRVLVAAMTKVDFPK